MEATISSDLFADKTFGFGESSLFGETEAKPAPYEAFTPHIEPVSFTGKVLSIDEIADRILGMVSGTQNLAASAVSSVTGFVSAATSAVAIVVKATFKIIGQAIRIAVFKFAIEFCAISIQSMMTKMTSMSLNPPRIDTPGVFYNGSGTAPTPSQPTSNTSSYGSRVADPHPFAPGSSIYSGSLGSW